MKIAVKNMVCPRCIAAVKQLLEDMDLNPVDVQLGEATLNSELTDNEITLLKIKLNELGFELLEDNKIQMAEKIKAIIINHIHHLEEGYVVFSELLSNQLHKDYSGLSKLFSSVEGITIEQYVILQKIEKVKELLQYNELTLSEIAHKMGYSSVAHLSAQFRKTTGVTPSFFKLNGGSLRKPLDSISKTL